jgi:hypothetical protein
MGAFDSIMARRIAVYSAIVLALLALGGVFYNNANRAARWFERPHACDWFIFLRQARLFQENGAVGGLDTAIRDSTTLYVIEQAKRLTPADADAGFPIGPFCHTYKARTDRLVIVAPPGTGLVLSLFPEGRQARLAFIAASAVILLGLAAVVLAARRAGVPLVAGALGVFCFLGLFRFMFDWSIPPSAVLALAAGYLSVEMFSAERPARRALAALLLGFAVGLASDVRVANLLLLAGPTAVAGLLFLRAPSQENFSPLAALAAGFLIGCIPLLAANAINAGHPLLSTYAPDNTEALRLDWTTFAAGLHFYFVERLTVGIYVVLAAAATLALFRLRRRLRFSGAATVALAAAINLAVSTVFLLFYSVRQHYYPFPMTVFVLSAAAFALIAAEDRAGRAADTLPPRPAFRIAAGLAVAAVVLAAFRFVAMPLSPDYSRPDVNFDLPPDAVVWAGHSGGHFHYFLRRQASLLHDFPLAVQDRLVRAIANDGRRQFIVADFDNLPTVERLERIATLRRVGRAFGSEVYEIVAPPPAQ